MLSARAATGNLVLLKSPKCVLIYFQLGLQTKRAISEQLKAQLVKGSAHMYWLGSVIVARLVLKLRSSSQILIELELTEFFQHAELEHPKARLGLFAPLVSTPMLHFTAGHGLSKNLKHLQVLVSGHQTCFTIYRHSNLSDYRNQIQVRNPTHRRQNVAHISYQCTS